MPAAAQDRRHEEPQGRIDVTDAGITLRGPNVMVHMTATDVQVNAENTAISSAGQTNVISGGRTSINGAAIRLNGSGCPPVARVGDRVQFGELGTIVTGSPSVTSC